MVYSAFFWSYSTISTRINNFVDFTSEKFRIQEEVDWSFLNPNWASDSVENCSNYAYSCLCTAHSRILEMAENIEFGQ